MAVSVVLLRPCNTMSYFVVLLCFSFLAVDAFVKSGEPRGIQLRLTQKGLDYSEYNFI